MTHHLLCLTIDTDPDGTTARLARQPNGSFQGMEKAQTLPEELDRLSTQLGQAVPMTWFVRVDRQIEAMLGCPAQLLTQFTGFWNACAKRGDEMAWHPHLCDRVKDDGLLHALSGAKACDELEALWEIVRKTTLDATSFRNGEAWHTSETYATVERLGFGCDSTIIPGRHGGGRVPADWTYAPNCPYYPASEDLCYEGPERPLLEVPLNGWQTQAAYDPESRIRYMNPAVHEDVFSDALKRWRLQLLQSDRSFNIWTLVLHPDEIMAQPIPDALYAHSRKAFSRNLLNMAASLAGLGHSFEFATMAVASKRWRTWSRSQPDNIAQELSPAQRACGCRHRVAAGMLPAVEPGILPGGMSASAGSSARPGGKMPPSTAVRMPAATAKIGGRVPMHPLSPTPN
jgi:hypothetical protein